MNPILLDRNENQYGPAPACYEVLRKANLEHLGLYSREYLKGRKGELSSRLSEDFGIPEERVLLSYGSEDMLKQVVHCYLQPGKTLLLPRQSWWYYKSVAAEVFGRTVEYSLRPHEGVFVYDPEEIADLYDAHQPQVILLASPNNPTGNSIPPDTLNNLVRHCSAAVVILDQAYAGFSGEAPSHVRDVLDTHERLIVLRTFSKYYALAGLRIGYACAAGGLTQLIAYSSRYLGYNRLSEKIALAALDDDEYYTAISRAMNEDKRLYYAQFRSMKGFTPFLSDANFLLVGYPQYYRGVLQREFDRRNIVVKFFDDPVMRGFLRVTIGTRDQNEFVRSSLADIAEQHLSSIPFLAKE